VPRKSFFRGFGIIDEPGIGHSARFFGVAPVKKGKNQAKECKFRSVSVENSRYETPALRTP
jgi:hypothetical protein